MKTLCVDKLVLLNEGQMVKRHENITNHSLENQEEECQRDQPEFGERLSINQF